MQNEREINLGDLILYVLSKWKWLILAGVIGLVLVGGFKFYKAEQARSVAPEEQSAYKAAEKTVLEKEEALIDLQNQRAALDVQEETNTLAQKRRDLNKEKTTQLQNYLSESILMNINASAAPKAQKTYKICIDLNSLEVAGFYYDPEDELVEAYGAEIELTEDTLSKYSVPAKYLNELVSVVMNWSSDTVTVTAYGDSLEMAEALLQDACAIVEGRQEDIAERYLKHELKAISESSGEVVDSELATLQANRYKQLDTYYASTQGSIATAEELAVKKAALELDIEEAEAALEKAEKELETAALSKSASIAAGLRFGLIGGIAFIVLLAVIFFLIYVFDGKIHTVEEPGNCHGIPLLAGLSADCNKKCRLDRWFYRRRNKGYGTSNEVVLQTASVVIGKLLGEAKSVAVLSTLKEKELEPVTAALAKFIPGVRFIAVADSNASVEAAEKLRAVDAVIVYEKREASRIREIDEEMRQARLLEKNIIGCIVS